MNQNQNDQSQFLDRNALKSREGSNGRYSTAQIEYEQIKRTRSADKVGASPFRQTQSAEQLKLEDDCNQPPKEFTEVFSWGSDRFGQLGLGKQMSDGKSSHNVPRLCSYNIPIFQISCGAKHAAFITTSYLCYTMGSNEHGQLGVGDPCLEQKCSPVLVDFLLNYKPTQISCGSYHTVLKTKMGDAFSWGSNEWGQCGTKGGNQIPTHFSPQLVNFDQYYRPNINNISAGGAHTAFVDDIGRLFICGKGQSGQLGLGTFTNEMTPYYVTRIPEKVSEAACGEEHTVVLTQNGEIYTMGSNARGQLGTGTSSHKGSPLPTFIEELSFSKMIKVRAGTFSACLSSDGQLYIWGEGYFGKFYTPHKIKSAKNLEIVDFVVSRGCSAAIISRQGKVYSWGSNDVGQLGHGDMNPRQTPQRLKALEGKKVTQICMGEDFAIALGLTLPSVEIDRLAKSNGILRLKPDKSSDSKSKKIKRLKKQNLSNDKHETRSSGGKTNYQKIQEENLAPMQQDPNTGMPLRRKSKENLNSTIKPIQENGFLRNQTKTKSQNLLKNIVTKTSNNSARSPRETKLCQEERNREIHELQKTNSQNREIKDLRYQNERLQQENIRLEGLERKNNELIQENSQLRYTIQSQGEAIKKARELKAQTDRIICDYDQCKTDIDKYQDHNKRITDELKIHQQKNHEAQSVIRNLEEQFSEYKSISVERQTADHQQIQYLSDLLEESRRMNEELKFQLASKTDECHRAFSEIQHLEVQLRRTKDENDDFRRINDDLEVRNRHMQDKINSQIYSRATEYKEQTMKALQKSDKRGLSMSPTIEVVNQRARQSPLRQSPQRSPQHLGIVGHHLTYDLASHASQVNSGTVEESRISYAPHNPSPHRQRISISPKRISCSPQRHAPSLLQQSPLRNQNLVIPIPSFIDESYSRMKKSCDRIAQVLGLDRSILDGPINEPRQTLRDRSKETRPSTEPDFRNLRERSPPKEATVQQPEITGTKFASTMVKQSLQDLKERLANVRREKENVDQALFRQKKD